MRWARDLTPTQETDSAMVTVSATWGDVLTAELASVALCSGES